MRSEGKDVIADLCKLMLNSIYGKTVTRDIEDTYVVTTIKEFIKKGDDEHIKDFDILGNGQILMRTTDIKSQSFFPSQFGSYILSHSRKAMNEYIHAIDGFNQFKVWYTDTDSIYIDEDSYYKLMSLGYVGDALGQGKNDNGNNIIIKAYFAGPKQKYCILQNQMTGQLSTSISFKGVASSNITEDDFIQIMELQDKSNRINKGSGETIDDDEYIYRDFQKWS